MCDKLIVGVTTDELATYKGKYPVIPLSDRIEIVRNIKCVDAVVAQSDMNKLEMCKKLRASVMFVGDDWYQSPKWEDYEKEFYPIEGTNRNTCRKKKYKKAKLTPKLLKVIE